MSKSLEPCPRCEKGRLVNDLAGDRSCINCGFEPRPTSAAALEPVRMRRGPKVRWEAPALRPRRADEAA